MLRCFQSFVLLIWFVECAGFRHIGQRFSIRRICEDQPSKTKLNFLLGFDFDMPTLVANFVGPALEAKEQVDLDGVLTEPDFFEGLFKDTGDLVVLVAGISLLSSLSGQEDKDFLVDAANYTNRAPTSCPQCKGSGTFFGVSCGVCSGTGKIDYSNPAFQLPGEARPAKAEKKRVIIENDNEEDDIDPTNGKGWMAIFDDDDDNDDEEDYSDNKKNTQTMSKDREYETEENYTEDEEGDQETENNSSDDNNKQQKKRQTGWFDSDEV